MIKELFDEVKQDFVKLRNIVGWVNGND